MRAVYIAVVTMLIAFGGYSFVGLKLQHYVSHDEPWLYSIVPSQVADYAVQPTLGPTVSYRMDDKTYGELKPIGIAGQTFKGPDGIIDAVVIAGDRMESFHDQRWCFRGQGWDITDEQKATLRIPGYGNVPMFLMKISKEGDRPHFAAFTFKTPTNFRLNYLMGQIDYLTDEIKTGHPNTGFSFRFIGLDTDMTQDEFIRFIEEYMLAAKKSSGGIL